MWWKFTPFQYLGLLSTLDCMKVIALIDSSSVAQSWTQVQQKVPFYHFRQENSSMKEAPPYSWFQPALSIRQFPMKPVRFIFQSKYVPLSLKISVWAIWLWKYICKTCKPTKPGIIFNDWRKWSHILHIWVQRVFLGQFLETTLEFHY